VRLGRTARCLLGGVTLGTLLAGCRSAEPRSFKELLGRVAALEGDARGAAIDHYIAAHGGKPLIENHSNAIFVVQDRGGATPRLIGDFNNWAEAGNGQDPSVGRPTRIQGTDWSYLEASIFTNARAEYVLLFEREAIADPKNPHTVNGFAGPRSEVRMPQWVAQPELDDTSEVPAGDVVGEAVPSKMLGAPRRVWFYTPPGYAQSQDWYPVLYVLDGANYVERMRTPTILDRLIARKAIQPLLAVFIEPVERQEEYSRNPRWRAFMAAELVPLVDKRFRTFPAPEKRIVLGSSLSAYGAVDLAVEYPATFGLCAALAPPAQTPTVITNQAKGQQAIRAVRFFVLAATYDSMAMGGRRLRTALDIGTGAVTYEEVPEGHSTETFRGHIDDAVRALLPPATN
jgi:enterochelin esterase-like enzyme